MLRGSDGRALHLCPIYTIVQLLIYQANCTNIISTNEVDSPGFFDRWLGIVWCSYDTFGSTAQDLNIRARGGDVVSYSHSFPPILMRVTGWKSLPNLSSYRMPPEFQPILSNLPSQSKLSLQKSVVSETKFESFPDE